MICSLAAYETLYRYLEFSYNRKRSNSTLGYLSPWEFEKQYYQKTS
ncbi:hypothetical protein PAECIP111890_05907 [Paenibacillus sp. JJ-223]|nr:hypothetical protein PAECIP111890_05907 [Paenibacillus sp. JJ-223]